MPVLMVDVARRAGVSVTTVSHVMNGTRGIAPGTRERVLKAIRDLRYTKNSSARLLVRGQSDLVGIIISDLGNPFLPPLVKSFEAAASTAGLEVLLGITAYEPGKAAAAVQRMIGNRARGVAVMTSQLEEHLIEALLHASIPVVALDFPRTGNNKSSITVDYSPGIAEAVDHLYAGGHREVSIIHGPLRIVSAQRYYERMLSTLDEYGMTLLGTAEGDTRPEGGATALATLLRGARRPSAILCGNDLMAIGAMGAASQMGVRVPGDLSIIGSDDIDMASYSYPPLSTVRVPRDAIGYEAFRLLERMIGPPRRRGVRAVLATGFVQRGSSGPCRRAARLPGTGASRNALRLVRNTAGSGRFR